MTEEEITKVTQLLDKVSEQGIRHLLYNIIQKYPDEALFIIEREILKSRKIV